MSDYLSDEEQLAKLKSWWDENGRSTIAGLVIVAAAAIGWRWYDAHREDAAAAASDLFEEFLASEGETRQVVAARLSAEAPGTAYEAFMLMHLAHGALDAGDYEAAEEHLQAAVEAAPEPVLADLARIRLARVQQQRDRPERALQTLGAVRGEGYRPQVAELKGDIHMARGERREAHEAYLAAQAAGEGGARPVLAMKVADTADALSQGPADQPASPGAGNSQGEREASADGAGSQDDDAGGD